MTRALLLREYMQGGTPSSGRLLARLSAPRRMEVGVEHGEILTYLRCRRLCIREAKNTDGCGMLRA